MWGAAVRPQRENDHLGRLGGGKIGSLEKSSIYLRYMDIYLRVTLTLQRVDGRGI